MTMPHLMNCSHSPDGWCISCVAELNGTCEDFQNIAMRVYREHAPEEGMYTSSDEPPQSTHAFVMCDCGAGNYPGKAINHYDDCLWKSAETLLKREGLI
jgi:hypothetical protein